MATTPIKTGHGGSILIAASSPGTALSGKIRGWNFRETANYVESRGAGMPRKHRVATDVDWEATFEAEMVGVEDLTTVRTLLGSDAFISLKGDTDPYFSGQGMLVEIGGETSADDAIVINCRVVCSEGE